jgi:hypothetical protein
MGAVPLKRESGMKHGDDVYGQNDVIKEIPKQERVIRVA